MTGTGNYLDSFVPNADRREDWRSGARLKNILILLMYSAFYICAYLEIAIAPREESHHTVHFLLWIGGVLIDAKEILTQINIHILLRISQADEMTRQDRSNI